MRPGDRSLVRVSTWKGFPKMAPKLSLEGAEELTKKVGEARLFHAEKNERAKASSPKKAGEFGER